MSPRRKSVNIVRDVGVDPRYGFESVQKFINVIMWRGKKNTARRMLYDALDIIAKKSSDSEEKMLEVFHKAVFNSTPIVEVRAKRIGGSVYQIPREVSENRGRSLAFRSIIAAATERKGKSFAIRLADELWEAAENKGGAVKIKLDKHKMADANKAFAHYAR
jgi:small subunit ribosomal protein S7